MNCTHTVHILVHILYDFVIKIFLFRINLMKHYVSIKKYLWNNNLEYSSFSIPLFVVRKVVQATFLILKGVLTDFVRVPNAN